MLVYTVHGQNNVKQLKLLDPVDDYIAPCADAQDYDRGSHALDGNTSYRGPHVVPHWIASLTHYCFPADSRTTRDMLESRADNDKFINYLAGSGYCREKDFNSPHERAALMTISREHSFETRLPDFEALLRTFRC
ncbi:GNAT domain-domain-containing protein [Protomyces lactucae-debilis]|uniref:GNAT domain-domain-containing protein n=1 Tax=Protomyces lactucae-debilis TaxID=2754530 RepID=A0A1Y2F6F8_PROLT|nr:GNAT domain-containing protein [Protomyces lactucae-debilis]ORY79429.1 GNAT domain-domain-containing protein [Protomyces lactucae-debilis]